MKRGRKEQQYSTQFSFRNRTHEKSRKELCDHERTLLLFFLFQKEKLKTRTVKISSQLEKKGEKKKTQAHASEVLAHYKFQRQTEKKKKGTEEEMHLADVRAPG